MSHHHAAWFSLIALLASGCVSQIVPVEDHAKSWIGRPLADYKAMGARSKTYAASIGWSEKWTQLANGNREFLVPVREDCLIRWEVDSHETIVAYRTEGARCY